MDVLHNLAFGFSHALTLQNWLSRNKDARVSDAALRIADRGSRIKQPENKTGLLRTWLCL